MVQWSDRACVMLVCHPDPLSGYPNIRITVLAIFLIKETIRYILTFYGIRTKYVVARMPLPKTDVGASK